MKKTKGRRILPPFLTEKNIASLESFRCLGQKAPISEGNGERERKITIHLEKDK